MKRYTVTLEQCERDDLSRISGKGSHSPQKGANHTMVALTRLSQLVEKDGLGSIKVDIGDQVLFFDCITIHREILDHGG